MSKPNHGFPIEIVLQAFGPHSTLPAVLDVGIRFLVEELNTYLYARQGAHFGEAAMSRLVDDKGSWVIGAESVGVTLLNIEEDRVLRSQVPETTTSHGRQITLEPQLRLNLLLVFTAFFNDYVQSLKQLSHVLTFFQSHPVFTPSRNPGLDPRIEKLSAELQSMSYEQLNQIWGFIGSKQLPSAFYRVRMIALQDAEPRGVETPLTRINPVVGSR